MMNGELWPTPSIPWKGLDSNNTKIHSIKIKQQLTISLQRGDQNKPKASSPHNKNHPHKQTHTDTHIRLKHINIYSSIHKHTKSSSKPPNLQITNQNTPNQSPSVALASQQSKTPKLTHLKIFNHPIWQPCVVVKLIHPATAYPNPTNLPPATKVSKSILHYDPASTLNVNMHHHAWEPYKHKGLKKSMVSRL